MSVPRTIAVLTTGRQDWGLLRSTAAAIQRHPDLRLRLLVGGTHLSEHHGATIAQVRDDGFVADDILDWMSGPGDDGGTGAGNALAAGLPADAQAGRALELVGAALRGSRPDALVLAGDRLETAAAAIAATIDLVPIAHLHGGEETQGAFDDALRHAITKLAHLHLVSHEEHGRRVIAMGEDPSTVFVVGAPGLDVLATSDLPDRAALEASLGIRLEPPVVLVTVHPTTLAEDPVATAAAVAGAMARVPATYVVTLPNADPDADAVRERMRAAASEITATTTEALGSTRYWGMLRIADAILGNSSSGIIEAAAVRLPAVDVGDRQAGRLRGPNVLHAPDDADAVARTLLEALDPAFRGSLLQADGVGTAGAVGDHIAAIIAGWEPRRPPRKASIQLPGAE